MYTRVTCRVKEVRILTAILVAPYSLNGMVLLWNKTGYRMGSVLIVGQQLTALACEYLFV